MKRGKELSGEVFTAHRKCHGAGAAGPCMDWLWLARGNFPVCVCVCECALAHVHQLVGHVLSHGVVEEGITGHLMALWCPWGLPADLEAGSPAGHGSS